MVDWSDSCQDILCVCVCMFLYCCPYKNQSKFETLQSLESVMWLFKNFLNRVVQTLKSGLEVKLGL